MLRAQQELLLRRKVRLSSCVDPGVDGVGAMVIVASAA